MKKRVLSLFLAFTLCFSMLPTAALAEEAGVVQDAANANSTYTTGENAGLTGGKDGSVPDGTDGGDADSSGEAQDGEADTAVSAVQELIDALPDEVTAKNAETVAEQLAAIDAALEALTAEQLTKVDLTRYETVCAALTELSAVQEAPHANHCVCGKDSGTTVNGHTTHNTGTTWTAADSLPGTAGSYYLTQSVSGGWTVPEGEVNLCLNGQTIDGSIKVGSGATLTLTDCSGNGKVQGEVTVNGGKFELYGGTIIGGVEVGRHSNPATGSAFTMYGGTISGNTDTGGVFLVGTTNDTDPPRFTMHGGTISGNTAAAPDGGGGGVYVGEKCSFTMDGGTITGNTATAGNGGGIYIHYNAGIVSISNATITDNKASATGNTSYGHGGGIYSERGVTVENVTITGNNSTFEGGGIYGKGAITLTDATVTGNNQYDVYYGGGESSAPKLTVSGSVKAGYYANYAWKLPILVSGALREDSVIRVGVREGINLGAIAEPASGVTLRAENFKADAADSETSLGKDGKVYLVPCTHEMDDTGYTCKKCHTKFDARVGESAYYQTLTKAFDAAGGSTVTLLRDVTLTGNCSAAYNSTATLDLNGKTVSSEGYYIGVGDGNHSRTLTVKDSGTGGGTQALDVTFYVSSNGTLTVDNSYTGEISRVELQAGGALERFGGKIGELALSNAAGGSTSTGYNLKLWNGNTNACTIGKFTDNNKSKSLTVKDLLGTDYAKCELYGENSGTWSVVDKSTKIAELTGYTAYKVQFPECVHQCSDDSNPVCSVCNKNLYTKITAQSTDGTTKTAYFTEDSALEHGYVEAIQTLNGWSNEGCTEPTLTLLRDMYASGTSMPLTGTLTLKGGTHTAKNVTVAENANVTFASGIYEGATIDGTATVKAGVTFTDSTVTVNGTLNVEGGTFNGPVEFNGSSIANISGGTFTSDRVHGGVQFSNYSGTGTISGGTFVLAWFYTTKVKLSGGTFNEIVSSGDNKLAALLAEGAAYYGASDNQAVTNDRLNKLENVKVVSHTHDGGTDGKGICSICNKQMAAALTVGDKTSWYAAFATAIEAANAADGAKTITLYQDVNGYADGHSTTYELTHGPVTLATGGKTVTRVGLIAKGISLTVTGSNGGFYVTVDGKDAELTVNDKDTELAIVTAKNGGKLSLSNGTFSRVAVKDDGSSASLSGGSYGEITSDTGYVKPYALLAKGYAYKRTRDNKWLPNANSISSEVTVEKAPFVVEKIYPNNDTGYTGNSAFATDGSITLTAVIAPEMEGVTYYYWWELFNESTKDWTTYFGNVNTATHTGKQSKTLSISNLPENSSYQYHVYVSSDNGYNCYSEPFTVTRHQHSWTYTASGATITASCTDTTCTSPNGGSVTINAPAADTLTYNGKQKAATVTSSDWKGVAIDTIAVAYAQNGNTLPSAPTDAGKYTASITVGEGNNAATASVKYTIQKANPVVTDWPTLSAPVYVNSEATLTGGSGEGTFAFKADAAKSWDSAGSKTTTIVFTPTDTNNYNELTQDCPVTVVKRTVKNCNTLVGITDKPCGTAQDELGLPGTVTITTVDGKTFNDIPVTWSGYDPNTLKEQTLTGTLDLTSIAGEVEQPSTPVAAQIKVKLTQKHFSGISPEAYDGVYDGKAHGITLTGVPSGATVKYGPSANSCTQDSLTYTNFTNGAKIVYYKVSKSGYADASGSAWVNITKRPLTVTGITANDKAYDGNTNVVLDYSAVTLVGVLKNDTLTVTATGTLESAGVGKQKVTISDLTLSGDSAANYVLAKSGNQSETTANITAREVTVTITPNGGTYGSVVAAAAKLTGAVDGKNVPVTLTYTGNGYNDTAVPINAGSYTVTASIANSNYTLTGNTTATFVITPKAVTVTGITAKDKVYDGTKNADISSVTFDGVTLNQGTDYNVTASFEDAGVGSGKNVTATVTLIGQAAQNYALEQSSFPTTGSITKAAAPDFTKETALAIINGYKKTYTVTLPTLPTPEKPKEYGAPTYELGEIKLNDGYYTGGAKVENGELTLPIQKNDVKTTGSVGTATVVIKSTNYEDITLTVKVNAANKIEPTPDGEITATPITYGDTLSNSKISGKMKDPDTGIEVKGTFAWPYPNDKPKQTGDYKISWIFTPDESYGGIYAAVTDPVKVHVAPKSIEGATITLEKDEFAYKAAEQSPKITRVTLEGWSETITYRIVSGDKATNANDSIPLTIEGTGNYTGTATVEWKITPKTVTPTIEVASCTYTGDALKPTVTVKDDIGNIIDQKEYEIFYSNNTNAGTATVTIKDADGGNYVLSEASKTFEITKAAAPTAAAGSLTITNGLHKTYSLDLSTLLPKLTAPCDYGTIAYDKKVDTTLGSGTFVTLVNGKTGELTLEANRSATDEGQFGAITVTISTSNYQDITLTIHVSAKNRITPTGTPTLSKNAITYGNALNTIALSGKLHDNVNNVDVDGTFEWVDGTHIPVVGNGTYAAEWIFEPTDTEKYLTVSGRSNITVEKAQQYGKVSMAGYTYGQAPSTPTLTDRTGDANAQVTYSYAAAGNGSVQTWDIQNPPALNAGTYRMYASIGDTDNYYGFEAVHCEFVVAKATPTYTKPTDLTAKYGQTLADVTLPDGWSWTDSSESVGGASTAAKTFQAKFTPQDTENYNTVENIGLEVMVNKADGGSLKTVELEQKYTDASDHTYTPDWSEIPTGQTWSYNSEYSVSNGSKATLTKQDFAADGSLLTYAISGGKAGDKITITLKSSCNNYEDFTITLTITLTEKDDQQALRITGGTTVVYGQTLQLGTTGGSGTGAVTYAVTNGTGEATIDPNTGVLTPVKVGSVSVIATKAGDASYNSVTSTEVEITITRATPTGAPKYTAITTSGKTLADAGLTVTGSTLNPNAGTLVWVDNAGNVLPGTTAVAANTTYKWLFTPTDANYTTLTGSIELYHKSSSSGGWYYTYYTIKATAGTNGSISPSGWTSVRDGWDQTFTITPDKGYAVAKVLVDGKSVGAVKSYTFKNVTKDHTIEAIFMKSNGNPQTGVFVDVAEGSYYEEAIDWAVEKGVTNGVSSNMFAPNDPCTRAQIVTFLWRAAGSPAPKSMSSFTDVPADAFYAKAVAWAVENGITSGTGESKFSPNATCTRAQSVTFLYRASGSPAVSGSAEFSDVATNAYYADAVAWAAKKGITTGIGGGLFGSDNDCTRGQIVTFLWRAMAE
jgi:predicted outer membrane repeat protein